MKPDSSNPSRLPDAINSPDDEQGREIETLLVHEPDSLPPEVEAGMRASFAAFRTSLEKASTPTPLNQESWITMLLQSLKHRPLRWAVMLLVIIAALVAMHGLGGVDISAKVYAQAAAQLREAKAMSCTLTLTGQPYPLDLTSKLQFKAPASWRVEDGDMVSIIDLEQKKGIVTYPAKKTYYHPFAGQVYLPPDLSVMFDDLQALQALPEKADSSEAGQLDGKPVYIYHIAHGDFRRTLYLDGNGSILRYEMTASNQPEPFHAVVTDFQLDAQLADFLFDLTPPAEYQFKSPMLPGAEQDFVARFRVLHALAPELGFNDLDPAKQNEIALKYLKMLPSTAEGKTQKRAIIQGIGFLGELDPQNDYHYNGAGKIFGNAADKIAWWKPTGSTTYRVLHGDLTLTDEPTAPKAAGPIVVN